MYGSPFPKLNPRVPYKTALERAGFEVNKGVNHNQTIHSNYHNEHFNGYGTAVHHGMVMSNKESKRDGLDTKPYVYNTTPSTTNNYTNNNNSTKSQVNSTVSNVQIQITSPSDTSTIITEHNSKIRANINNNKDSSASLFKFEQTRNTTSEINPIEKSFNMLTQRDSVYESNTVNNNNHNNASDSYGNDKDLNYRESKVKSLDFKPNNNLHVSIHPGDEIIPLKWNTNNDIDTCEDNTDTHDSDHFDFTLNSNSIQSQSNTNMNVEHLIAQLDDVSFSRNAKLNPPTTANNSSGDGLLNPGGDFRLKKSSAYLSGFPQNITKPRLNIDSIYKDNPYSKTVSSTSNGMSPQSITIDTTIESDDKENISKSGENIDSNAFEYDINKGKNNDLSSTTGTTPIFYNFKQNISSGFYSSSTSLLSPKEDQLATKSKCNDSGGGGSNFNSMSDPKDRKKYPPGEGPCRTCGLAIVTKGVYSKKPGELSGQWHKKCFKCTDCDIIFNKLIPCYILNDMPYCQKHYHENNNSICKVCNKFIEGECLENDKKERYHVNCLRCFICKKTITQDYFIFNDVIPLCGNHDMDSLILNGLTLPNNNDKYQLQLTQGENKVSKRRTRLINFQEEKL